MAKEFFKSKDKEIKKEIRWKTKCCNAPGAIYGIGMLGALVYYIQHATSFWNGALGVVEAVFWPAMVIYRVFDLLHL